MQNLMAVFVGMEGDGSCPRSAVRSTRTLKLIILAFLWFCEVRAREGGFAKKEDSFRANEP